MGSPGLQRPPGAPATHAAPPARPLPRPDACSPPGCPLGCTLPSPPWVPHHACCLPGCPHHATLPSVPCHACSPLWCPHDACCPPPRRPHHTCNPSRCPATHAAHPRAATALQSFCHPASAGAWLLVHTTGEEWMLGGGARKRVGGQPATSCIPQHPATAELCTCPGSAGNLLPLGSRESGGSRRWDLTCATSQAHGGRHLLPPVSVQASRGPHYILGGHCHLGRDRPDMQG